MDGTKLFTDVLDLHFFSVSGREASCVDRSIFVRMCGPLRNEDPVGSSMLVG